MDQTFEKRLDDLREEARTYGRVTAEGIKPVGGPMVVQANAPEAMPRGGYYGLPIIKPPVWKWMIGAYFFIGGLAGMAGLIAAAALIKGQLELTRVAMWAAGVGGILSPILLTWDLGRPMRFINMLRVFKYQSPMSVGSWIVSGFGACAIPGLGFTEWHWHNLQAAHVFPVVQILAFVLVVCSGLTGIFLGTYTGALLAVTAVPAWNLHRLLLPFHFGMSGLGSASALMELVGFRTPALQAIGFLAASAEVLVMLALELGRHGAADRSLHEGKSGWTLRVGEICEGALALALRAVGLVPAAAIAFLFGALISRFGWLSAGTASARDPEAVLAAQSSDSETASALATREASRGRAKLQHES